MISDFELVNRIVNGYWYTFDYEYDVTKKTVGYDSNPLVYCFAPHPTDMNLFLAINIHHIGDANVRRKFISVLQSRTQFMNDDIRHFLTEDDLISISKNVFVKARRCYDKRKCRNVYRVKNGELGKYILISGDLTMSNPTQEEIKWNLDRKEGN